MTDGTAGKPYNAKLSATGTTGTVTWKVQDVKTLPDGLKFSETDGTITDTPTRADTFTFIVVASDNGKSAPPKTFVIKINPPG